MSVFLLHLLPLPLFFLVKMPSGEHGGLVKMGVVVAGGTPTVLVVGYQPSWRLWKAYRIAGCEY
ncbi:hypothetical protein LZ32DRAFT_389449 [Colletotrichum eremochloae]|nr:hypothetical protein LZ32DRAFT_389449 [Colletotrichum eremochloae]